MSTTTLKKVLITILIISGIILVIYFINAISQWRLNNTKDKEQAAYNAFVEKGELLKESLAADESTAESKMESTVAVEVSQVIKDQSKAIEQISNFINLINENKYDQAYKQLHPEYVKLFSITEDFFKATYHYDTKLQMLIHTITEYDDRFIINCQLFEESAVESLGEDFTDSEIPSTYRSFTILKASNGQNLMDKGIISIKSMDFTHKFDNMEVKATTIIQMSDQQWCFKMQIKNTSNEIIQLRNSNDSIMLMNSNNAYRHYMYERRFTNYTIDPGETNTYTLEYSIGSIPENDTSFKWSFKYLDGSIARTEEFQFVE